jgi:hypothetical protein
VKDEDAAPGELEDGSKSAEETVMHKTDDQKSA